MICPFCKNEIADKAKFCTKCGTSIPRCPSCNKPIIRKVKFCETCGNSIPEELTAGLPEKKKPEKSVTAAAEVPKVRFCKQCGDKIYGDQPICDECRRKGGGGQGTSPEPPEPGKPIALIIIIILLLLAICGVGGYFGYQYFMGENTSSGVEVNTGEDEEKEDNKENEAANTEDDSSIGVSDNTEGVPATEAAEAATQAQVSTAVQTAQQYARMSESALGEFNGHAYLIFNYEDLNLAESYEACERFCESMGGHLAVIESQEENDYIYNLVTSTTVNGKPLSIAFFGYSDAGSEGNWYWVNGSQSTYTNWCKVKGKKQPNNGKNSNDKKAENYAEFYKETANGTWNDSQFGKNTYRFVCEWDG